MRRSSELRRKVRRSSRIIRRLHHHRVVCSCEHSSAVHEWRFFSGCMIFSMANVIRSCKYLRQAAGGNTTAQYEPATGPTSPLSAKAKARLKPASSPSSWRRLPPTLLPRSQAAGTAAAACCGRRERPAGQTPLPPARVRRPPAPQRAQSSPAGWPTTAARAAQSSPGLSPAPDHLISLRGWLTV